MAYYSFGSTSFSNYIWVNSGNPFYNPSYIDFERVNKVIITVEIYDRNNRYMGKGVTNGLAGWASVDLSWLPRGMSYKLKLVNSSGGTAQIKHGNVSYSPMIIA